MISYSNHVGLYSEDLDFITKRQLGNFPQAYSHLAVHRYRGVVFGRKATVEVYPPLMVAL